MKSKLALIVLVAISFATFSQPMFAARKKTDPRLDSLRASLQAVSPDALGGRLGLAVANAQAPSPAAQDIRRPVQVTASNADQLAYRTWKSATNS